MYVQNIKVKNIWYDLVSRVKFIFKEPRVQHTLSYDHPPGEVAPWAFALCELIEKQNTKITDLENRLVLDDDLLNKISENISLIFNKLKAKEPTSPNSPETLITTKIEKKKDEYIIKNGEMPNGLVLDHRSFYQLEKQIINPEKQKLSQYNRTKAFGMEIFVVNRNETIIIPFKNSNA